MLKKLRDNIYRQRWPAYIEVPLVSLVYLAALILAAILLASCCFVVLVAAPQLTNWARSFF